MSYEVQGRQQHQWFGHGTGDGADRGERELGAADIAAMVVAGAAASLSGATRAGYERYLADGGLKALAGAVPVWAAGSGLDAGAFKRDLVGPALGGEGAAALQDLGWLVRGARDAGDLQAASERLAAAVEAGGSEFRYGLTYARGKAGYAAAHGLVPKGGASESAGAFILASTPMAAAGPTSEAAHPGIAAIERAGKWLSRMKPWGPLVAGVIGAGIGAFLYFSGSEEEATPLGSDGLPNIVEAKPPRDADDPNGAKAPGKPGAAEGFEDPKGGADWSATKEGQYGWKDADGNIWVPTGWAGAPGTGSTGPAHGGPHWDVLKPNGDKIKNVYPGGRTR